MTLQTIAFPFTQIAAKIGGDTGTTTISTPDYGYGGQKRPLEDGGKILNYV